MTEAHRHERQALARLGWTGALERELALLAPEGAEPARVVARHRGRWTVGTADESGAPERVAATVSPAILGSPAVPEPPAVGDWVAVDRARGPGQGGPARIVALLPRSGVFVRRAAGAGTHPQVVAANVDVALVVASLAEPVNERRLERYAALAWESGAAPLVLLTKLDRAEEAGVGVPAALEAVQTAVPGAEALAVSALTGAGLSALEARLAPGRTAVLLGPSGVGKSTLLNRLLGEARQETRDVRRDGRGRHTTTRRELFVLPGGALVIDTPGMREVGLWSADAGLAGAFPEIEALAAACRFRDCAHDREPGCAVRAAVDQGTLAQERLEGWHRLRRELAYQERRADPTAAAAEAARWRTIHRSLRVHLKRRQDP